MRKSGKRVCVGYEKVKLTGLQNVIRIDATNVTTFWNRKNISPDAEFADFRGKINQIKPTDFNTLIKDFLLAGKGYPTAEELNLRQPFSEVYFKEQNIHESTKGFARGM